MHRYPMKGDAYIKEGPGAQGRWAQRDLTRSDSLIGGPRTTPQCAEAQGLAKTLLCHLRESCMAKASKFSGGHAVPSSGGHCPAPSPFRSRLPLSATTGPSDLATEEVAVVPRAPLQARCQNSQA